MPPDVSRSHVLPRAVSRALVLFCAMMAVIVFWFFTRPPDDSVLSVSFTMMTAGMLCGIASFSMRVNLCIRLFAAAGTYIFLSAMLLKHGFLLILMSGCMIPLVSAFIRHRRAAGIVMVVGQLAMSSGYGFQVGADRVIALAFSAAAALTASLFYRAASAPSPQNGGFTAAETLRLAVASMAGIWIWQAFRIPEGAWIPATPAFLYMATVRDSDLRAYAAKRLFGTILGMYAGMLFLSVLTFFDYRMIYLIPFLACFGFFLNFLTGNYMLYSLFFMMSFCLYSDFAAGPSARFHLFQLTMSRILCTAAGILLTLIAGRLFPSERKETISV